MNIEEAKKIVDLSPAEIDKLLKKKEPQTEAEIKEEDKEILEWTKKYFNYSLDNPFYKDETHSETMGDPNNVKYEYIYLAGGPRFMPDQEQWQGVLDKNKVPYKSYHGSDWDSLKSGGFLAAGFIDYLGSHHSFGVAINPDMSWGQYELPQTSHQKFPGLKTHIFNEAQWFTMNDFYKKVYADDYVHKTSIATIALLHKQVQKYHSEGKKVILRGSSYGGEALFRYLNRYGNDADFTMINIYEPVWSVDWASATHAYDYGYNDVFAKIKKTPNNIRKYLQLMKTNEGLNRAAIFTHDNINFSYKKWSKIKFDKSHPILWMLGAEDSHRKHVPDKGPNNILSRVLSDIDNKLIYNKEGVDTYISRYRSHEDDSLDSSISWQIFMDNWKLPKIYKELSKKYPDLILHKSSNQADIHLHFNHAFILMWMLNHSLTREEIIAFDNRDPDVISFIKNHQSKNPEFTVIRDRKALITYEEWMKKISDGTIKFR